MASGHVNRVNRPDTWLHRPMLQNVKKALANPEPSTHNELSLVHAHPLQAGAGPQDEDRSENPHPQKHELHVRGGNALFAPTTSPNQSTMVPIPKPAIQTGGNTNFTQNVEADDKVLSRMTLPCVTRCKRP